MNYKYALVIMLLLASIASAQNTIGLGFTRIGVGPRQTGMANSVAGVTDDAYQMIYNPGMMGFNRNWQISIGYNKWIADTQQNSAMFLKQWEVLGSKKSTLGIGYVGFDAGTWDATNGAMAEVSAGSHMLVGSLAQRLDWIPAVGRYVSIGVSGKYLMNDLGGYSANGLVVDTGIALKTKRFLCKRLSFFDYYQFALGGAFQNYNLQSFTFVKEETVIPTLLRLGASLNIGKHDGASFLLSFDMNQYENEDFFMNLGSELWFNQLFGSMISLGGRAGYEFDRAEDMGTGLNLGASLRFQVLPRGVDARFDYANSDFGDILESTYRGGATLFPTKPEIFGMALPQQNDNFLEAQIEFRWEESEDPDPWDKVRYFLLVDNNVQDVQNALDLCRRSFDDFVKKYFAPRYNNDPTIKFVQPLEHPTAEYANMPNQLTACFPTEATAVSKIDLRLDVNTLYHWSVIAFDLDHHIRIAHGSGEIRQFTLVRPCLSITDLYLDAIEELTPYTDPRQGTIKIRVANEGTVPTPDYKVEIYGTRVEDPTRGGIAIDAADNTLTQKSAEFLFHTLLVPPLQPHTDTLIVVKEWETKESGTYRFYARGISQGTYPDLECGTRTARFATIYTIPKWNEEKIYIPLAEQFTVATARYHKIKVPVLPWVFFDPNSFEINENVHPLVSPLRILARRLRETDYKLTLTGFVDTTRTDAKIKNIPFYGVSDDPDALLAQKRAKAVKQELLRINDEINQQTGETTDISEKIIVLKNDKPFEREIPIERGASNKDYLYINNENRRVLMAVDTTQADVKVAAEKALFHPEEVYVEQHFEKAPFPSFLPDVLVFAPDIEHWDIEIYDPRRDEIIASLSDTKFVKKDLQSGIVKITEEMNNALEWKYSIFQNDKNDTLIFKCRVHVVDKIIGLNRKFTTIDVDFTVYEEESTIIDQIFNIYWFDKTRIFHEYAYGEDLIAETVGALHNEIQSGTIDYPEVEIQYLGHTDITGMAARNKDLSLERAETLKERVVKYVEGHYSNDPRFIKLFKDGFVSGLAATTELELQLSKTEDRILVGDNENPLGRNFNRRSEIKILRK